MEAFTIKGNKIVQRVGNYLKELGNSLAYKNRDVRINPNKVYLGNACTLIIEFSVDNDKFQIVLQGDYRDYYTKFSNSTFELKDEEVQNLIKENKKRWYKRFS